jgi:integrase
MYAVMGTDGRAVVPKGVERTDRVRLVHVAADLFGVPPLRTLRFGGWCGSASDGVGAEH